LRGKSWLALGLLLVATLAVSACNDIINYPAPRIKALQPDSINAGNAQFTLTVTGFQFTPASSILWNGSPLLTQFSSSNALTAQIPSSLVQNPGSAVISVFTPQPGGGITQNLTFNINPNAAPVPLITSISPTGVLAGSPTFQLFIYGSNFLTQSIVTVNGDNRVPVYVNSSTLQVSLSSSDVSIAGFVSILVVNPSPGGGASQPVMLTVTNPVPRLGSLTPTIFTAGTTATTVLQIGGSSFVPNSQVEIDGSPQTTIFGGSGSLAISLTAGDFAAAGSHQVTVLNPGPGGGTSNVLAYDVTPTLTAGLPVLLDVGVNGAEANQGVCGQCVSGPLTLETSGPSISSNGADIVFASTSTNLVANQSNTSSDIFLRTSCVSAGGCTPATSDVSLAPNKAASNGSSSEPSLDSGGAHVAFTSTATNLVPGVPLTPVGRQVYWGPVCASTSTSCQPDALVSMSADGVNPGNGESYNPMISPDGRYVAFVSLATNLVSGLTTLDGVTPQVFLRDTCSGTVSVGCTPTTYLVSTPDGVTPGDGPSSQPSVSNDGTYVSFTSTASNLGATAPNPNSAAEIFLRNVCFANVTSCHGITSLVSTPDGVTPANGASSQSRIISSGRFIVFASTATNLVTGAGPVQQVYMYDTCLSAASTCSPSSTLVSTQDGVTPGNGISEHPSISPASGTSTVSSTTGELIAFASRASNLGGNTANGVENIFVRRACIGFSATTSTCTPTTALASQPGGTSPPQANADSLIPAISADGHTVAFLSSANNLVANDTNGFTNVFQALTSF